MDGRSSKPLAYFAAACVLFGAAATFGQAMRQIALDPSTEGTAEAPRTEISPQAVALAATLPAPISATTKPVISETPKTVTPAASTEPAPAPRKADEPTKVATVVSEAGTPVIPEKTPTTKPVEATLPSAGDSRVSIESKPIRPATNTTNAPSPAPAKPIGTGFGGVAQVGTALAVVIGLILIGKAVARKFLPGAKAGPAKGVIEILARHPLAKNQSIVLVRIGSQIVALNQGRESSESVLVISEPTEVAKIIGQIEGRSPDSISAGFNKLLANARMDLEESPEEQELQNTENLDEQLEEMAAAKRQLMELRQHVRSVRDRLPRE